MIVLAWELMGIYRLGLVLAKIRDKQKVLQRFPECCKDFHVPTGHYITGKSATVTSVCTN